MQEDRWRGTEQPGGAEASGEGRLRRGISGCVTEPTDSLQAELDALFQRLPAAHVEARKALADRLRKAGDRAGAERVKKIKRPSPTAWAINQLFFREPQLLEAAQQATAALQALHARDGVGPGELSGAVVAQRRALQAALDVATRLAAQAGQPLNSADQRKVETTLKAWLAGAGDEEPGRMTHELEASGFAAVTAVGLPSSRPPSAAAQAEEPSDPPAKRAPTPAQASLPLVAAKSHKPAPDPARLARVRANVQKREQEEEAARKLAEQLQDDLRAQEAALDQTRTEVQEAERTLRALKAQLEEREAALRASRSRSVQAGAAANDAAKALAAARAELSRLTEPSAS